MKKIISLILVLMMIFAFAACSGKKGQENSTGENGAVVNENAENGSNESKEISIDSVKKAKETPATDFETEEVDGGLAITKYIGEDSIVSVPNEINGVPVVEIGEMSFAQNGNLKAVKIGDSVLKISKGAFFSCENLEVFVAGKGLNVLGDSAFLYCRKLKSVELNDTLEEIQCDSFVGTDSLEKLYVSSNVSVIDAPFVNTQTNVTIITEAGSAAEDYAKEAGIKYEIR